MLTNMRQCAQAIMRFGERSTDLGNVGQGLVRGYLAVDLG